MSLKEWFFETGEFSNPYYAGQWKTLHIITLIVSIMLIVLFYHLVKYAKDKEKTKDIIIKSLVYTILFFEVAIRVVYFIRRYYFNVLDMQGLDAVWILLPKPWCAVSCFVLILSIFIKKKFFYNYAALSALLTSFIYSLLNPVPG